MPKWTCDDGIPVRKGIDAEFDTSIAWHDVTRLGFRRSYSRFAQSLVIIDPHSRRMNIMGEGMLATR